MAGLSPKLAVLLNKGLDLHKSGDLIGALTAYNSILKKKPQNPDALWLKGAVMIGMGEAHEAVPYLERAIKRRPDDAAILNDLGMAHEAAGDGGSAREAFNRALSVDDSLPSAMINVARYALADGNAAKALEMTERALKKTPHLIEGHNTRGLAFRSLGQFDQALKCFAAALSIKAEDSMVLFNKGDTLWRIGDAEGAAIALNRVLQVSAEGSANWVKAAMTLGLIAAKTGDPDAALTLYNSVLVHDPAHLETLVNRGELKHSVGDLDGARRDYEAALSIDPNQPSATYNRSRLNLLQGRWADGWDSYEARWQVDDFEFTPQDRGLPHWMGEDLSEGKLLIWGEQGLGDQIQFASQIRDVVARGVQPVLEVDPRLVPLFNRNFDCPVFAFNDVPYDEIANVRAQSSLGSLSRLLRRDDQAFEPRQSYLEPDQERVASLRAKYLDLAKGRPVIGVSWTSINPTYGSEKSLPLQNWSALIDTFEAFYVSLQYGDVQAEIAATSGRVWEDKSVDPVADIEGAVAQIGAVDLVISISNTAVHLAGAQGKSAWVLVPAIPEWRWGLDREYSPWYPDVAIYRQTEPGNWQSVLDTVREDLAKKYSA